MLFLFPREPWALLWWAITHSFPITLNVPCYCLVSCGKLVLKNNQFVHQKASPVSIGHVKLTSSLFHCMPQEASWHLTHQSYPQPSTFKDGCTKIHVFCHQEESSTRYLCLLIYRLRVFIIVLFMKPLSLSPKTASSHHKYNYSIKKKKNALIFLPFTDKRWPTGLNQKGQYVSTPTALGDSSCWPCPSPGACPYPLPCPLPRTPFQPLRPSAPAPVMLQQDQSPAPIALPCCGRHQV